MYREDSRMFSQWIAVESGKRGVKADLRVWLKQLEGQSCPSLSWEAVGYQVYGDIEDLILCG